MKTTTKEKHHHHATTLSRNRNLFATTHVHTLARKKGVQISLPKFNFHLLIFLLFNISSRISDVLFWIVFAFEVVQVIIVVWESNTRRAISLFHSNSVI